MHLSKRTVNVSSSTETNIKYILPALATLPILTANGTQPLSLKQARRPPSMTMNTGPTVATIMAPSHVIATGIGPVMRGWTMRLPHTLLGCLRMLSPKPSPVLEKRGLGFLSRQASAVSPAGYSRAATYGTLW